MKCLQCRKRLGCGSMRGLCASCIGRLKYAVVMGRTTFAAEEAAGRCLRPTRSRDNVPRP